MMNLSFHVLRQHEFPATVPRARTKPLFLKFGIFTLLLAASFFHTDLKVDRTSSAGSNDFGACTDQNSIFASDAPSGWNGFTTLADFYDTFEKEGAGVGKPASGSGK
ncbi:hypothetical protein ACN9ML_17915 [Dyadobacter endophyticus]|uniref:hypothetical protein n=1 Tax=Dyadobacter endophyticus TaxID=1749036 RepID=UPI003CF65C97